jgi:uncharacterized membrane protein YsdA (DUF1294 family)
MPVLVLLTWKNALLLLLSICYPICFLMFGSNSAFRVFFTFNSFLQLFSFVTFAIDKALGQTGHRRIPENVLLTLCLFGGWCGGLLGMLCFNHKTKKNTFKIYFAGCVTLNLVCRSFFFSQ